MAQEGKKNISSLKLTLLNMLRGGLAGCVATATVIPLDVTKTWLQLQSESGAKNLKITYAFKEIIKSKGFRGFYSGLDSALLRQFCFASMRVGLFLNAVDLIQKKKNRALTLVEKAVVSMGFGAFGAFVINPLDVVLVRAWADVKRPPAERRNYKNIFDGLIRVTKEEGITTLWRASTPNIARAIGLNLGMMLPYQQTKEYLYKYFGDTLPNHAISSVIAGICASTLSLPFDNVKVKLVNMKPNAEGKMPYKGFGDCLLKSIRKEGVIRLWSGFLPFTANLAPHSIITLLVSEALRKGMTKYQIL